jgi:hypothetical protein
LFHTDPAVFAIEVVASPAGVPCIPVAAGILADANIPAIACFPAVDACLTATNFRRTSLLKLPTFLESGRDDSHLAPLALRAPVLNLRQITFSKKESFGPNIVVVRTTKFNLPCP